MSEQEQNRGHFVEENVIPTDSVTETSHDVTVKTDKNIEVRAVGDVEVEVARQGVEVFSDQTELSAGGDFHMVTTLPVSCEIVDKLCSGFVKKFLPQLEKADTSVKEVLSSQQVLIESVEQEKARFAECSSLEEVKNMMIKAKLYYNKLVALKKEMLFLHDKSVKLKKRAVRLQQQKQKDEMQRLQQLEREQEKERMLTARLAKQHSYS